MVARILFQSSRNCSQVNNDQTLFSQGAIVTMNAETV
jgi:hypothetical protein